MKKGRMWMLGVLSLVVVISQSGCSQTKLNYDEVKEGISKRKSELSRAYSDPKCDKDSVVRCAQQFLFTTMTAKVFPCWYGTKWDYNGTTEKPRTGHIACGYFVTTTMRDLGFRIPRVRWAQLPSESMIKEMTTPSNIKRYRFADIKHIESEIFAWGDGLYVVGMDNHTGYIVNHGGKCQFVHSYFFNWSGGVVSENLDTNNPLRSSEYRVIGKILTKEMVRKWLLSERFP
ncbi:MAG: hypothetical protein GC178_17375 [Flavobacteriales bacterium]|nr:hypothetical protein [Flavobacteriales bacterium]